MVHFHSFGFHGFGVIDHTVPPGAFGVNTTRFSNILGSVAEIDPDGERFIGDASMEVLNIAPKANGTVHVRINVGFFRPLNGIVGLVYFPNPSASET